MLLTLLFSLLFNSNVTFTVCQHNFMKRLAWKCHFLFGQSTSYTACFIYNGIWSIRVFLDWDKSPSHAHNEHCSLLPFFKPHLNEIRAARWWETQARCKVQCHQRENEWCQTRTKQECTGKIWGERNPVVSKSEGLTIVKVETHLKSCHFNWGLFVKQIIVDLTVCFVLANYS